MLALAAPHGPVVPVNPAAIVDKGAVDGLAVPVGSDVLVAAELALRRHSLLVGESQVAAALADQASMGTIAIAIPGAFEVPTAMPVTATAATSSTSSTIITSSPIRSVRPIDLPNRRSAACPARTAIGGAVMLFESVASKVPGERRR